MKILHVITGLNVGGAETMLYRLASSMDPLRFQSRVVSLIKPGPMGEKLSEAGVRVDSLNMQRGVPSPLGLWRLLQIIREYQPDVVQTWLYHADLAGLLATRLAHPLGGGPKVTWNIRCSSMALGEYRRMTSVTLQACRFFSGQPDMVLTNSQEARRFHQEIGYKAKSFEVIPNGFDLDRFKPDSDVRRRVREELSIEPDKVVVGQVARFDAMKDHRTMVQAAAKVARETGAVFVLAGQGVDYDNLDLAGWLKEYGLPPEQTRLLGLRSDMERIMASFDIHVSSSTGEGFPNVVGEAMACGVPNVVTDVGDSALLVGQTGRTVTPDAPDLLAVGISSLVTLSPSERKALGVAARERMEANYSLSGVVGQYEEMYERLLQ